MSFKTTLTLIVLGLCAAAVTLAGIQLSAAWKIRTQAEQNLNTVPQLLDIKTIEDTLAAERLFVYAMTMSSRQVDETARAQAIASFDATDSVINNSLIRQRPELRRQALDAFDIYKNARLAALDAAQISALLRDVKAAPIWLEAAFEFDNLFRTAALNKSQSDPAMTRLIEEISRLELAIGNDALELAGLLASQSFFNARSVAQLSRHETEYSIALESIEELATTALPALSDLAVTLLTNLHESYSEPRQAVLAVGIDGGAFPEEAKPDAWMVVTKQAFRHLKTFRTEALRFILETERQGMAEADRKFLISAAVIGATIVSGVIALLVVMLMVVRPLRKSVNAVKEVAEGRVDFSLSGFSRRHELGALTAAIHALRDAERKARAAREARLRTNEQLIAAVDDVVSAAAMGEFDRSIHIPHTHVDAGTQALVQGVMQLCDIVSGFARDVDGAVAALSQGELTHQVKPSYDGLFGDVMNGVSGSMSRVSDIVSDVQMAAGNIDRAVEKISSRAADASSRASHQTNLIHDSRSIVEELSTSVSRNSDAAQSAAQAGQTVVEQTVKSVQMIEDTVQTMADVEQSSRDISDIVNLIEEIAFQTNILALNASVEAARAGSKGSGFAVVAQEVRALARRVSDAAMNIGTLINTSVVQVRDAAGSVRDTNKSLHHIRDEIGSVVNDVQSIAAVCRDQASGATAVAAKFEDFNETARTNQRMSEENSATAEALAENTRKMMDHVAFFQTKSHAKPAMGREDAA